MGDHPLPKVGAPATRALAALGVTNLTQVAAYSAEQLMALHGCGPRAVRILQEALQEHGLSLSATGTPR